MFWRLICCWSLHLQIFFFLLSVVFFVLFMVSFAIEKLLSLNRFALFIFCFVFITVENGSKKTLLRFFVKECSAYVFLQEFYSVWPQI